MSNLTRRPTRTSIYHSLSYQQARKSKQAARNNHVSLLFSVQAYLKLLGLPQERAEGNTAACRGARVQLIFSRWHWHVYLTATVTFWLMTLSESWFRRSINTPHVMDLLNAWHETSPGKTINALRRTPLQPGAQLPLLRLMLPSPWLCLEQRMRLRGQCFTFTECRKHGPGNSAQYMKLHMENKPTVQVHKTRQTVSV